MTLPYLVLFGPERRCLAAHSGSPRAFPACCNVIYRENSVMHVPSRRMLWDTYLDQYTAFTLVSGHIRRAKCVEYAQRTGFGDRLN